MVKPYSHHSNTRCESLISAILKYSKKSSNLQIKLEFHWELPPGGPSYFVEFDSADIDREYQASAQNYIIQAKIPIYVLVKITNQNNQNLKYFQK